MTQMIMINDDKKNKILFYHKQLASSAFYCICFIFFLFPAAIITAMGQHTHSYPDTKDSTHNFSSMSHSFSLNLPMNRNGSGTSWMPDAAIMYGHGLGSEKWNYMFHANFFARYNKQDITKKGKRGSEKFDAPNWIMAMGQRQAGKRGLFHFSSMISLEPLTVGGKGYPLLFQSGETYNGKRLVDRQHPHDFFSELSVAYSYMISKNIDIITYIAYPGEAALGPVVFMHRLSGLNNPDAPLGHHWQDATHISFGVATLGFRYKKFKIESSRFNGREPDEKRFNFDKPRFDSYSYRLSYNPTKQLALQVSQAFLKSPEAIEPENDVLRTTASLIYQLAFAKENHFLSTSLIWGNNNNHFNEHSVLIESLLQLDKTAFYGRYEWVEKSALDLDLATPDIQEFFSINAFTFGTNRVLFRKYGNNLAAGIQGSLFIADDSLTPIYGKYPFSSEVYLRFYPYLMHMHHAH